MRIRMMQNGGGGLPPFTYYLPVMINTETPIQTDLLSYYGSGSGEQAKSKENTIGEKDILSILSQLGKDVLPNDLDKITLQTLTMLKFKDLPGALMLGIGDIALLYVKLMSQLNYARHNKAEFEKTYKSLQSSYALRDPAITLDGRVLALIDGKPTPITLDLYFQNGGSSKINLLTNAELLNLRAENPEFSFKNGILNIVNSAASIFEVLKYINSLIAKIGSTDVSNNWYESRTNSLLRNGVSALLDASEKDAINPNAKSVDGLFSVKETTSDQRKEAIKALTYLYKTLPEQYKVLLKLLNNSPSDENAVILLSQYIDSKLKTSVSHDEKLLLDDEGLKLGATGKKLTKAEAEGNKTSPAALWYLGFGAKKDFVINDGTTYGIHVKSNVMALTDKEGKSLGRCNLQEILQSQYGPMFDILHASMNGEIITMANFEKVLTDGLVYSIDMPVDPTDVNHSRPDLKLSHKMEEFYEYLRDNHIDEKNITKVNEACEKFNLPYKYNADGELNYTHWKRFAVMNAAALNSAFNEDVEWSDYVHEVMDENLLDSYIEAFRKSLGASKDDKTFKFDKESWLDTIINGDHDSVYEGTLFIPLHESYINAISGAGTISLLGVNSLMGIEANEQLIDRIKNMNRVTISLDDYE